VQALLHAATDDRVRAVRSAAIEALGAQVATPDVGEQLMQLLENAESPLVQLALVDLVLRNGNAMQLQDLLRLADAGLLHPELVQHVTHSLRGETV